MPSRIGGTAANENLQATPLAEDGFLYIVDQWGVVYKIDVRSGDMGRIVWRMDPGQEKLPLSNRGAALWGNLVISTANYPARVIATNKDTGKVVWETNLHDQPDVQITAAPLAVKDKIIVGAAGGDRGVRDWIAALDGATGKLIWRKYVIPAPGEPGSETWKDKNNAWQTGGGAMWITGSYDPATNQVIWGTGNPVPMFDPTYRPGDNLYTNSMISWNPDSGSMNWYFQYTPGDMWDYDEAHTHILIDGQVGGQPRKLITHSARNGFLYTFERSNGQTLLAKPYVEQHQLDRRASTRRPASRSITIPTRTSRPMPASRTRRRRTPPRSCARRCRAATITGRRPTARRRSCSTSPRYSSCNEVTLDTELSNKAGDWKGATFRNIERVETDLIVADPFTGDVKKSVRIPYPNYQRRARDRRRPYFHRLSPTAPSWPTTTPAWSRLEDQRRHRLQCAADDVRGQRQAIRRDPVRLEPDLEAPAFASRRNCASMRNQTMLFVFGL